MQNIRKIRLLRNYTMRYVADVINCDQAAYSRWESGQTEPKISYLLKIADLFGMSIDDMLNYDPEHPPPANNHDDYKSQLKEFAHRIKQLEKERADLNILVSTLTDLADTKSKYLKVLEEKIRGGGGKKITSSNHKSKVAI